MSSIKLAAMKQLAVEWPAGGPVQHERLWRRLVKQAGGDAALLKRLWHAFKARLRMVDASGITTRRALERCIEAEIARRQAPKKQAATKRHQPTIMTVTPEQVRHEAAQAEAGKSFAGKGYCHPTLPE